MKPTLYGNDVRMWLDTREPLGPSMPELRFANDALNRFSRILPNKCLVWEGESCDADHECGGSGFLYPDLPDFASVYVADRVAGSSDRAVGFAEWAPNDWIDWHRFCHLAWKVLGIVEDTEDTDG